MAKPTSKMIKVTSRGMVRTSRGRIRTPINFPYRENVEVIWNMLTVDRAEVWEQLKDKTFVKLTVENFDLDNNLPAKQKATQDVIQENPTQSYAKKNPESLGGMSRCMAGQTTTDNSNNSKRNKKKRNKDKRNQQQEIPEPKSTYNGAMYEGMKDALDKALADTDIQQEKKPKPKYVTPAGKPVEEHTKEEKKEDTLTGDTFTPVE